MSKRMSVLAVLAAAATAAGCGATASGGGSGARATVSTTPPATGCGSFTRPPVKQIGGAVSSLPASAQPIYQGYGGTVRPSAWMNWKPSGSPPFTVGIVWGQLLNDFQTQAVSELQAAFKRSALVGNVVLRSTGSNLDIGQQLQLFRSMLQSHPALIVLEENEAQPFIPLMQEAAKAGIPTVVFGDTVPSPYAVSVYNNAYDAIAVPTSYMVRTLGGKGSVLFLHSIPGLTYDTDSFAAASAVLKNCPNVKHVGDVYGDFDLAVAKSQVLQFLATHPERIDGVVEVATMAPAVISAFQQAGRPVPMIVDVAAMKGSLGYWRSHLKTYTGVGSALDPAAVADGTVNVAERMLEGQGLKVSDVLGTPVIITDSNLAQWVPKGATLATPGAAIGPPNNFVSDGALNPLFVRGAPPKRK